MDAVLQTLHSPIALAAAGVLLACYLIYTIVTTKYPLPDNVPWVGRKDSKWFATLRTKYDFFTEGKDWLAQGYSQYSKHGKSYINPDLGNQPTVVVPRSKLRWLLDFPDSEASVREAHRESLFGTYQFFHPYLMDVEFHAQVIRTKMGKELQAALPGLWEETQHVIDKQWGLDSDNLREITIFDDAMKLVANLSGRLFVSLPLCRDPAFLKSSLSYTNAVGINVLLLSMIPKPLLPILGRLFTLPNWYFWWQNAKITVPEINKRKADLERKQREPDWKYEAPNDYLTWHLRTAMAEGLTKELDSTITSQRLMILMFSALHTTSFTIAMTLINLLGSDPRKGFVEGIREEVEAVWAECDGVWTKAALGRLHRIDSAVREAMRTDGTIVVAVARKVMNPHGIRNAEEGWTAPHHANLYMDAYSTHQDPELYPKPEEYDAFRFSRPREVYEARQKAGEAVDENELSRLNNTSLVSTSDSFLGFGAGKHACPGRFFVSMELKILIAHIVMNYDLEPLAKPPKRTWLGQRMKPPMDTKIRVKRRQKSAPSKA